MQNAFWDWEFRQASFGDGWASADDLVGHEYTHGYTEFGAGFFFWFQSGALDEVFSDFFGELVDITNGRGTDTSSTRWLIGEDLRFSGAIRDMQHPPNFDDPDRVRSPLYATGTYDSGRVHANSGIGNKAAYLLTDGGTFNGYTVTALGISKAAAIFFDALMNQLTSASDYNDLFDALQQACIDQHGSFGLDWADCKEVRDAVLATEMHLTPNAPLPRAAPVCDAGEYADDVFSDDLEDPAAGRWEAYAINGTKSTWYYPQNTSPHTDFNATWASSGERNFFGDDPKVVTDAAIAMTSSVDVPAGGAYLRFQHGYSFDRNATRRFDGGVVEISTDGGYSWSDLGGRFTSGGYTGTIASGTGNRLAGRRAFTGESWGYGASRVDLADFGGGSVWIRFRTGTDSSISAYGWFVDDVRIYRCRADSDAPAGDVVIDGGAETTPTATVLLSFTASDATTNVARMRVSNSPTTVDGLIYKALELPFRDSMGGWSLNASVYGGDGATGTKRVYVQFRDRAGNWSDVISDSIELTGG